MNAATDVCSEILKCSAQMPDYGWVSAAAALASAIAALFGLYYSHSAKSQTTKQACRETFDRMHGESFGNLYKEIDSQFQILRTALLSKKATAAQVQNIIALARAMPTDQLKKICVEIDPTNNKKLVDTAEHLTSEVTSLAGTVTMQNADWYESANDSVQQIQFILLRIRNQIYEVRNNFIPPSLD